VDTALVVLQMVGLLALVEGLLFPILGVAIPNQVGNPSVLTMVLAAVGGIAAWAFIAVFTSIAKNLDRLTRQPEN